MNMEILLVVIIIIMLFMQYDRNHHKADKPVPPPTIVSAVVPPADGVSKMMNRENMAGEYEATANQDNIDYYQTCGYTAGARAPCTDPCNGDNEYAVHEYGSAGLDFKDWAAAQAIDPQVVKNHGEFIKDRLANSKTDNITGRTYSPSEHDSYNPINGWVGILGRPQMVKVCNPQQVNDVNPAVYATEQRMKWKSS
jgi:hypothetical protein